MERLFNLDFQLIHDAVILAVAIFVLFLALSYLLLNPVRKMLYDRQRKIQGDIDSAKGDKEKAAAMKAEYEEKRKTHKERIFLLWQFQKAKKAHEAYEQRIADLKGFIELAEETLKEQESGNNA